MSLEQSIAALTQQAGLLLDLPRAVANQANAKITELQAAYNLILSRQQTTFVVDQANGSDNNSGSFAAPFKSIEKALSLTPRGGSCMASLHGPYHVGVNIEIDGKRLYLTSTSGLRHALTFERVRRLDLVPTQYEVRGFLFRGPGLLHLNGIALTLPFRDGAWAPAPETLNNALFRSMISDNGAPIPVSIVLCDIVLPAAADRFCPLFRSHELALLQEVSNSLTGTGTSLNGNIMDGITASEGTASASIPNLVTNRATI